jgi:REP-associated tyrosine transposase
MSRAQIAQDALIRFRDKGWYWLYASVVMPDHLHLLLKLRESNRTLGIVVATIKSSILFECRRAGFDFVWQDQYYDHVVREYEQIEKIISYILQNPARAGLVRQGEPYAYAATVDNYQ